MVFRFFLSMFLLVARWVREKVVLGILIVIAAATTPVIPAFAAEARFVEVVVDGIGDTPQAAMRNAAENGLKNVLGSYVQTETTLTRTTDETNSIVTRGRNYQEKYREYSRGVLKDVERISVTQQSGIYRAVVRVTVKVID